MELIFRTFEDSMTLSKIKKKIKSSIGTMVFYIGKKGVVFKNIKVTFEFFTLASYTVATSYIIEP